MAFWNGTRWLADQPARPQPHRAKQFADWIATLLMIALVPALLIVAAGGVFAAKPTSSVWVDESAPLAFGSPFTVEYSSHEREPWALVQCYPNGSTTFGSTYADGTIWGQVFSAYPGGPSPQAFVLGASIYPLWTGGGADCVVSLVSYSHDLSRQWVHATAWFTVVP